MDSWYIAQRLIIINAEIVPNIPLDIFGRDIAYVVKYQSQRGRPIFNIILIENHEMHLTTRPILLALYLGYGRITLFGISTKATTTDRFVLFCHIMDISSSLTVHKYNENRVRGNRTPLHERICTSMQLARIDEKKTQTKENKKKPSNGQDGHGKVQTTWTGDGSLEWLTSCVCVPVSPTAYCTIVIVWFWKENNNINMRKNLICNEVSVIYSFVVKRQAPE